jgi:hypothetical protein
VREHVDGLGAREPVAGLLVQQLEVAGERGRVAGDVDDARRPGLGQAAQGLAGQAGAGRIDDDDIGAPERSFSSRMTWPTLPAKKAMLPTEFRSAFSSAQATDSSEISIPQTERACRASVSPIVPVPQ